MLMNIAAHFAVAEGYCRFCPHGPATLPEVVEAVTGAIAYCRDQKMPRLLVNVTGLEHSFTSEREALEWLLKEQPTDGRPTG